jgi:hypothetical protein
MEIVHLGLSERPGNELSRQTEKHSGECFFLQVVAKVDLPNL